MNTEIEWCKGCGNKYQHCTCEKPRVSDSSQSDGSLSELIASQEILRAFVRKCARGCKPGGWDYDREMARLCETASKLLGDGDPWK